MRAFIALEPDPAAHAVLQTWLRRLRHSSFARDVKWVNEDVTLFKSTLTLHGPVYAALASFDQPGPHVGQQKREA
jgi:2'-5' RNA ligase